jgi:putative zinc finger protein
MRENGKHISDQDLLLAADNELPGASAAEVRLHLSRCEACTERMRRLEEVSADVTTAYRSSAIGDFANVETARRRLLRRMAEQRADSRSELRHVMGLVSDFFGGNRRLVYNAAFAIAAILVIGLIFQQVWLTNSGGTIAQVQAAPLPRPNLTPGATRAVPTDVCLVTPREDTSKIPVSEQKEVFREYGMDYRHAGQYELDHLITPALGGTDDIHNLWPEPYASTEWNAHVKDQLEDRLHEMVCSGQIDLPTAQRAISTNWIEAYKLYFHTDEPLGGYSVAIKRNDNALPNS